LVEGIILLSASRNNASQILRDAAEAYRVDTDAIALKVKQEFAAKDKTKKVSKPQPPKPRTLPSSAARETRSANQQTSFHFPMRPSFPPSAVARALARTPWPSHPTG
jgi:hypothetical protein